MRPLPSPPTSAAIHTPKSSDESIYGTPSTTQSYAMQLPIAVEFPSIVDRPSKARRREGRIFTHSASSSISSFDSATSCTIISAEFWMPLEHTITIPVHVDVPPAEDETKVMPHTPTTPKTRQKSKPANIIIPHNTPTATVAVTSPTSPRPPNIIDAGSIPCTPRSPLSPFLAPTPNRRIQSPNARVRKLAKLTRTLGENIPVELVFPSGNQPTNATPVKTTTATRASPSGPRLTSLRPRPRTRPAAPEWPLTPTPDCTINPETHTKTAVGLHYALGVGSLPTRARAANLVHAAPALTSPPPFSTTFTMDDVAWEHARQAAMAPRAKTAKKARGILGGVRKPVVDNGRGTWRKKENTWSGEWNVEDMELLQVQLRRLRR